MIWAKKVEQNAGFGIVATGSPVDPARLSLGIAALEQYGYRTYIPLNPSLFYGKYEHGFANGSPHQRAAALHQALSHPDVSAVIAARGGYGCLDILPLMNFQEISQQKKIIVGCSDVTALLVQCVARAGITAVHGPTIASSFADSAKDEAARCSVEALLSMLSDPAYRFHAPCEVIRSGYGEGPIIAGNLTMLAALLGTPWDIDYRNTILVLEEVGEAPYRVHRLLSQLKLAGKLDALAGLVFGRFSRCSSQFGPSVDEVINGFVRDMLGAFDYPVLSGFPFGHWGENQPVPLGCRGVVSEGQFGLLESPVA